MWIVNTVIIAFIQKTEKGINEYKKMKADYPWSTTMVVVKQVNRAYMNSSE